MPILRYLVVVGSVLLGLLFLAEAQWGPGVPPRTETNPLQEQMAQRAERAKARVTRTVGLSDIPAVSQAALAQASAAEVSATSRAAGAQKPAETNETKQAETKHKVAAKKKKTNVARASDNNQRYARYHTLGPPQYFIGYQ